MSALQKGFSHRKDAKNAKIFKNEVKDLKSFPGCFDFPSRFINFSSCASRLRGKRFVFFQ
jgi:hypothetical protein